ncbi:hypothetical protein DSC91_003101 [Paraburkholderia caffeinilytica]|nr:S8 family serine peptidase [Paraburkholderia caffeinilytica]AXL50756.1 hypothetical protein DSC91_003101 [Paraburkholderia caffeinilytica]
MQKKRRGSERDFRRETINGVGTLWSRAKTFRILAGVACVSLALAACGGHSGSDSTSSGIPSSTAPQSLEANAALAAKSATVPLAMSLKMNASSLSADASVDRFIVKYKSGTSERGSTAAVQSRLDRLTGALPSRARHLRRMGIGSDVVTTERKLTSTEAKAFMRAIASDPDVEYVEPDTPMSGASAPNDPLYSSQWGLGSDLDPGQSTKGIRAEGAWAMTSGAGGVIGLVDSGVTSHSDLDANILPGYDFTYETRGGDGRDTGVPSGYTCSITWHGTHVAGIMAAVTNNGIGIAGVAPAAKVVSARVLNGCANGSLSNVVDGIMWAAGGMVQGVPANPHPAKVINASLGGYGMCSATMQAAIDYATSRGAVVVVAAMNEANDAAKYQPANCHNVITVGNSARSGVRYYDSNYGPVVDIAAPGDWILSTYNSGTSTPGVESYSYQNGTSMSAPMVSGVVALAQSVAPTPLSAAEMRALIQQNAQPFPATFDWTRSLGAGILDATATIAAAKSGKIPAAADFTCSEAPNVMQVTCTDLSAARGAPIKSWAWNFGTGDPDVVRTQSVNPYVNFDYAGNYKITLKVTDSNGATSTLTRPFSVLPPTVQDFSVNVPTLVSAKNRDMLYFALDVPAGVKGMTVTLKPSNATESAWLYTRVGTPSVLHPECQAGMGNSNAATCTIANPVAGAYYLIIGAQSNLSSTLTATYTK